MPTLLKGYFLPGQLYSTLEGSNESVGPACFCRTQEIIVIVLKFWCLVHAPCSYVYSILVAYPLPNLPTHLPTHPSMWVCTYILVYLYNTCMHTYIHPDLHAYVPMCIHTYSHAYIHTSIPACLPTSYLQTDKHRHSDRSMCIFTDIHTYIYIHTGYKHTYDWIRTYFLYV